jgi:hypothetical protein
MSRAHVEPVQEAPGRTAASGAPARGVLHEDLEARDHHTMDAREYRGRAAFERWLEDWSSTWSEDTIEPEGFLDVAVIPEKTTGHGSAVTLERHDAMVFGVHDEKIVFLDHYSNRQPPLEVVGLTE